MSLLLLSSLKPGELAGYIDRGRQTADDELLNRIDRNNQSTPETASTVFLTTMAGAGIDDAASEFGAPIIMEGDADIEDSSDAGGGFLSGML